MSTAEALKSEIDNTPEPLLQEVYDFLVLLKSRTARANETPRSFECEEVIRRWPDFAARQAAIFGDRTLPDSQPIFDELRSDRL